jgi:hypothetical protein
MIYSTFKHKKSLVTEPGINKWMQPSLIMTVTSQLS